MDNSVLFGNGINRLNSSNVSWSEILQKIKQHRTFEDSTLPNTMIYERVILETPQLHPEIVQDEFGTKLQIASMLSKIEPNSLYSELFQMNFQHYITTNYDNAFLESVVDHPDINLPFHEYSSEDIYSIRRKKRISNKHERDKNFWQIHGEVRKPATIMLGLDHYCGAVGKIDSFIKGSYRYSEEKREQVEPSIREKFSENLFRRTSWIELFFTSNIHIFGLSLDFSEIDLWWILNKRARFLRSSFFATKIQNQITYYCHDIHPQMEGVLTAMDVKVEKIGLSKAKPNFELFYKRLFGKLDKVL